jgi:hypothetical protein
MGERALTGMVEAADLVSAALRLAGEGHPVLPLQTPGPAGCSCADPDCTRVGKHPRGGYGLRHASRDPAVVTAWWHTWPTANVGLRCDGLVVLDVDGDQGEESLGQLEHELGPLPATRVQRTGDGRHLILTSSRPIGNSNGPLGNPPGLDLRGGRRGYIAYTPSLHRSGRRYQLVDDRPPAPLPVAWQERLDTTQEARNEVEVDLWADPTTITRYGRAALSSELGRFLTAQPGARNTALCRSAFRIGQLVVGGQIPYMQAAAELRVYAGLVGLPANEAAGVIRRAFEAAASFPRSPGEPFHASLSRARGGL